MRGGGLSGIEEHYRSLSERFGYSIAVPESTINGLGYQLLERKRFPEAISAFRRNVELYPGSANVYDSLGEGLEAAGEYRAAGENFEKAIQLAIATNDGQLPQFEKHLERVKTEMKPADAKQAEQK